MQWEGILSHMVTPHTNAYAISFNNLISPFMLLCPLFFIHFVFPFWSFLKPKADVQSHLQEPCISVSFWKVHIFNWFLKVEAI